MEQNLYPNEDFHLILLLSLPLIFGGIFHMMAVKWNALSYLNKSIHQRWFGRNKTWRGLFIMPLATLPGVLVARELAYSDLSARIFVDHSPLLLSVLLGFAYCLAELPNSFVKRRLGINEGQTSEKYKWFFVVIDQADSVVGCMLIYKFIAPISWPLFLIAIIFGTALHLVINVLLFTAKLRKNPF